MEDITKQVEFAWKSEGDELPHGYLGGEHTNQKIEALSESMTDIF